MLIVDEGRPKETDYLVEVTSIDITVLVARAGSLPHCIEYAKVSGHGLIYIALLVGI